MRFLVIGSTGLLGQAVMSETAARGNAAIGAARRGADHTIDLVKGQGIERLIGAARPDVVINAAAITNLDECEKNPGTAYAVNAAAVERIAVGCKQSNARLVHISTDHLFSGDGRARHDERAPVMLVNEYARTKFAGEQFALSSPEALAVRTNFTGPRGWPQPTLFEWARDALRRRAPLVLFDDYFTSTIDISALARALLDLIERKASGLLNVASRDVSSKKEFIEAIGTAMGITPDWAQSRSVADLSVRHAESLGLDVSRAEAILGYSLPSLSAVAAALVGQERATTCVTTPAL